MLFSIAIPHNRCQEYGIIFCISLFLKETLALWNYILYMASSEIGFGKYQSGVLFILSNIA
jgi:hypothetical protein